MVRKIKQRTKKKEIYYYRPSLQKYDKEYRGFKNVDNISEELNKIFEEIKDMSLNKNDENNVYILRDSNTYNYILVNFNNDDYIYGMLISSSNDVYPSIEQEGNIIPLKNKLPPDSSLAHITHFVIFLKENIIGIEYNNVGARPTSVANYITNRFYGRYRMELIESVNSNTLTKLDRTHRVKELDIRLDTRSIIKQEVKQGELFKALESTQQIAKDIYSDDELTISIKIKSKYGFKVTNQIKEYLKSLSSNRKIEEDKKVAKEKIKIKSLSEDKENFDFDLVRQIIKAPRVSIKVNGNNMIDSDDMFEKIISNYEKYK